MAFQVRSFGVTIPALKVSGLTLLYHSYYKVRRKKRGLPQQEALTLQFIGLSQPAVTYILN